MLLRTKNLRKYDSNEIKTMGYDYYKDAKDQAGLTTRSNLMLNWTKPGPLLLTGVLGLRLPIITRGVLPKK